MIEAVEAGMKPFIAGSQNEFWVHMRGMPVSDCPSLLFDLRVEAIMTSASPRSLWLQLSGLLIDGLLYLHNNSWQVT